MAWDTTEIFEYFDGQKPVWADPLEIDDLMAAHLKGEPNKVIDDCASKIPAVKLNAMQQFAAAVCSTFQLQPFNRETGEGATWKTCLGVWKRFTDWQQTQKKSGVEGPTSSSGSGVSALWTYPTSTSLDSGSTAPVPTGVLPDVLSGG